MRRIGHVEIHDHIEAVFGANLLYRIQSYFATGTRKRYSNGYRTRVEAEEKRREREPWKFVGTLKFDPAKGRTLIRSIQLFLMEAKSLIKYANHKRRAQGTSNESGHPTTRKTYSNCMDRYMYGRIVTLDQVQQAVNKKEEAYSHAVSRQERHRLKKNAHDRIMRWEARHLGCK